MNQTSPIDGPPTGSDLTGTAGLGSWMRRHPVATFLGSLVLAIATAPFEEAVKDGDLLEAVRLSLVLLFALLALGLRRRDVGWGVVLAAPALLGKWGNHFHPDLVAAWTFLTPALGFILLVIFHLLRFIRRARRIDSEVLCAGVAAYMMLGLLWTFAYILVGRLAPDAFAFSTGPDSSHVMKGFTAVYFSFITLATVGYGDIAPVSGTARMLATMEAMTGTFYLALLISRLVSLYSATPATEGNDSASPPVF